MRRPRETLLPSLAGLLPSFEPHGGRGRRRLRRGRVRLRRDGADQPRGAGPHRPLRVVGAEGGRGWQRGAEPGRAGREGTRRRSGRRRRAGRGAPRRARGRRHRRLRHAPRAGAPDRGEDPDPRRRPLHPAPADDPARPLAARAAPGGDPEEDRPRARQAGQGRERDPRERLRLGHAPRGRDRGAPQAQEDGCPGVRGLALRAARLHRPHDGEAERGRARDRVRRAALRARRARARRAHPAEARRLRGAPRHARSERDVRLPQGAPARAHRGAREPGRRRRDRGRRHRRGDVQRRPRRRG